jgi:hypothetical protein
MNLQHWYTCIQIKLILYGVSGRGINYEFATLVHLYLDKIDTVCREWQRNKL